MAEAERFFCGFVSESIPARAAADGNLAAERKALHDRLRRIGPGEIPLSFWVSFPDARSDRDGQFSSVFHV